MPLLAVGRRIPRAVAPPLPPRAAMLLLTPAVRAGGGTEAWRAALEARLRARPGPLD